MSMAKRLAAGEYQIGIYAVVRIGRGRWEARATGPGTIGDGSPVVYRTFREAYRAVTGESVGYAVRSAG